MSKGVLQKEKPIIFSAEMVNAILEGRKTQTRRVIKPQPQTKPVQWNDDNEEVWACGYDNQFTCPFGKIGERLWVREKFRVTSWDEDEIKRISYEDGAYLSVPEDAISEDLTEKWLIECCEDAERAGRQLNEFDYYQNCEDTDFRLRSPIFMPRWASRLTLEITNIRVERVQDISETDALAEGVKAKYADNELNEWRLVEDFKEIWDQVHTKTSLNNIWDENPYVWVLEFKQIKKGGIHQNE